jgi:hypothetical protein
MRPTSWRHLWNADEQRIRPARGVSVDDGTCAELTTNEDAMSGNVKGNDWVASIVSGLIVGGIVALASRVGVRDDDTRDQVMGLRAQVTTLSEDIKTLKSSPYVRREDFDRELSRFDTRLSGVERALEQRGKR